MKNILIIGMFLFSLSAAAHENDSKFDTLIIKTSAVCGMCVETIEKGYAFEKGVKSSSVDLDANAVTIVYNTNKTDEKTLRTALTNMGYVADEMNPDAKAYDDLHFCCKAGFDHDAN